MKESKQKKKTLKKRVLETKISIPEKVNASIDNSTVSLTGPLGETKRKLAYPGIITAMKEGNIVISTKKNNAHGKKMVFTFKAHIKNMIVGVIDGYKYSMKICSGHFPMTVTVQGSQLVVKNFIGEKTPRSIDIPEGVKVKVEGDKISIESIDKELAGMTASRIEEKTKRRAFDPRIFQDGIYIVDKGDKRV